MLKPIIIAFALFAISETAFAQKYVFYLHGKIVEDQGQTLQMRHLENMNMTTYWQNLGRLILQFYPNAVSQIQM